MVIKLAGICARVDQRLDTIVMMNYAPPRDDDPQAVLDHLGPLPPQLLREAVESGFHRYKLSRALDPEGHAEYTACTKANMLYDRIAAVARELVDTAGVESLRWQISANKRATEVLVDPYVAFRIKRAKANRGGLTTSVSTGRQRRIKGPAVRNMLGQMVLGFGSWAPPMTLEDRLWLTVAIDLDDIEESLTQVSIGVELPKAFLWKIPLPEAEPDVIASVSAPLADRVRELRVRRSA